MSNTSEPCLCGAYDCPYTIIAKLTKALKHAETRLNEIPHNYKHTDFKLIREALECTKEK